MPLIGFIIFCLLIIIGERKVKTRKKKNKRRKKSRHRGTWWDSLNEGDKAWLYEHHK